MDLDSKRSNSTAQMSEKLRQKMEEDRQQFEALTQRQLQQLSESCRKQYAAALNTIAGDIRSEVRGLSWMIWARPALIGLTLLLAVGGGGWGLMSYLASQIEGQMRMIQQQRQTLSQLQARTWGLDLNQSDQGRFIVLPAGTTIDPNRGWMVGDREAIRLLDQ